MVHIMVTLLLLSLAIASMSMTIAVSDGMLWFRDLVSRCGRWLEELIHCPYCVSHYLACAGTIIFFDGSFFELLVIMMALVTLSSFASIGITLLFLTLNKLEEGIEE